MNFKKMTFLCMQKLTNFPYIEADFDALTNYELLCKVVEYLNKVIANENAQNEALNELAEAFNNLKTYVDNYFDNLDIQEEVDNKLDEMAESGQLADIIASYLNSNCILAYNTVADLEAADNLSNGSFARTYGKLTYNDGLGAFYKIRTVTTGDVIDGDNIVAITAEPTLIAEKMPDNLQNEIDDLQEQIDSINNRNFLFIGDSYGVHTQERGTSWIEYTIQKLGLTLNENAFISAEGSCGFLGDPNLSNKTFLRKLQEAANNIDDPTIITDIIIGGGVNDSTYTPTVITTAIETFMTNAKTLFPNATVSLGMISWSNKKQYLNTFEKITMCYQNIRNYGGVYIPDSEFCWHFSNYLYDNVHPTENASELISQCIVNYIKCGSGSMAYGMFAAGTITGENGFTLSSSYVNSSQKGNIIQIILNIVGTHTGLSYTCNNTWFKVASLTNVWLTGGGLNYTAVPIFLLDSSNSVLKFMGDLKIEENDVYLRLNEKQNQTTTDLSLTIKSVIVSSIQLTIPAVGN